MVTFWDDCFERNNILWRCTMSFNSTQMIHQLRIDFERLLALVTSPEAHTATIDQMVLGAGFFDSESGYSG